jgi:hypothetical protein
MFPGALTTDGLPALSGQDGGSDNNGFPEASLYL